MSLLNVTVKRASYTGEQASQLNTYVTLKLQNVKSSTLTVKGAEPCWEQDFLFEINNASVGLLVEVCTKSMIWDKPLGYHFIRFDTIPYGFPGEITAKWFHIDSELVQVNGEVIGTKYPTGHMILLDCRLDASGQTTNLAANQYQQSTYQPYQHQHPTIIGGGSGGTMNNSYDYSSGYGYDDGTTTTVSGYDTGTVVPDSYYDDSYYEQDELYYNSRPPKDSLTTNSRRSNFRGRSLERQDTLYDDCNDSYSDYTHMPYQPNNSFDQYDDQYVSEDRQWDSGGGRYTSLAKRLPDVPLRGSTSVTEGLYYTNSRGASLPATPPTHKRAGAQHRALPQPAGINKSPKMLPPVPAAAAPAATAAAAAGLLAGLRPKRIMPTPVIGDDSILSSLTQSKPTYNNSYHPNEDYNYAYQSPEAIIDNVYDPYNSNLNRKARTAALLPVPQYGTSAAPAISELRQSSFELDPYTSSTYQPSSSFDEDSYGYKMSSALVKKLPQPILKQPMKLPPIPNQATYEPMDDNDDSQFSRFNSYESESVPYSNSNDMTASMYSQPSTKHDLTYGNGDLDDFYDDPVTRDMPPDTTDISKIAEKNSNFQSFNQNDLHMEEESTDISKLANFQVDPYNNKNKNKTNDYLKDPMGPTTGLPTTITETATAYQSNEYYDNCQYEYEYTENEAAYLASGDIIDRNYKKSNIYQNNNNYVGPKIASLLPTRPTTTTEPAKQQEPNKTASILGQSKSLLGGLGSMINSGFDKLITTNTAPDAAAATKPSTTSSSFTSSLTTNLLMNNIPYSSTTAGTAATATTTITGGGHNNLLPGIPTTAGSTVKMTTHQQDQYNAYDNYDTTKQPQNGLEEYHEDFEYDQQPQQDFDETYGSQNQQQKYDNDQSKLDQINGYYNNENQLNNRNSKIPEDQFYNTYDDCMVFNEEDEDLYHEQLETGKLTTDVQLEEYKEDFEEDYLTQQQQQQQQKSDASTIITTTAESKIYVTSSQPSQYTTTTNTQPIQQDSFDDYTDQPYTNSFQATSQQQQPITTKPPTQRLLTKQETIMSETGELYNEYDEEEPIKMDEQLEDDEKYYEDEEIMHHEQHESQQQQQQQQQEKMNEMKITNDLSLDMDNEIPQRKSITIDEPLMPEKRHEKPKEKPTAKQRWHWAYNKIIMQLNVSTKFLII